jgi:hypothetical protein
VPLHLPERTKRYHPVVANKWSTPEELEDAVSEWLMNTIQKLELERTQRQSDLEGTTPGKTVGQA